jgi:peptide deformylase
VLRKRAKVVKKIDQKLLIILDDMVETLREADGIGLAGPQVGVLKRIVVIDTGEGLIELINPEITMREGTQQYMEGCLSYPGFYGYVERPLKLKVKALNREGQETEYDAEGLFAVAVCHELDHLDGVMFTDKVVGELYTSEQIKAMEEQEEKTNEGITAQGVTGDVDK